MRKTGGFQMKLITKLLVVSALFTFLFALPVMAHPASIGAENTDVLMAQLQANATKEYNAFQDFAKVQCGPNAQAIIAQQAALVTHDVAAVNKACAANHIEMKAARADLAQKVEATRKAQLDWFTGLSQNTNAYARELAVAQAEYAAAVQITANANAELAYAQSALANLL